MSYPIRHVADGVHILGPHLERFWPGNFAPLLKRFTSVLKSVEPELDANATENAKRLLELIPMSRQEFADLPGEDKPGWLVNMTVVELNHHQGDLLVYSPTPLDPTGEVALALEQLGTVRVVVVPHGGHVSGLASFKRAYPDALYLGPRAGSFLGFDLANTAAGYDFDLLIDSAESLASHPHIRPLMADAFDVEVSDDGAILELVLYHRRTKTVLSADTLYKSHPEAKGVGSKARSYLVPEWFADAYETLNIMPASTRYLPENREFLAKHPKFNAVGYRKSLRRIAAWDIDWFLSAHIDPIPSDLVKKVMTESWGWFLVQPD